MATGEQPGPRVGTAQCLLRLARDSEIDGPIVAQPAEPPYADPHVRWCDRDSGRPLTYVYCRPYGPLWGKGTRRMDCFALG